jgi:hypothetical protein
LVHYCVGNFIGRRLYCMAELARIVDIKRARKQTNVCKS